MALKKDQHSAELLARQKQREHTQKRMKDLSTVLVARFASEMERKERLADNVSTMDKELKYQKDLTHALEETIQKLQEEIKENHVTERERTVKSEQMNLKIGCLQTENSSLSAMVSQFQKEKEEAATQRANKSKLIEQLKCQIAEDQRTLTDSNKTLNDMRGKIVSQNKSIANTQSTIGELQTDKERLEVKVKSKTLRLREAVAQLNQSKIVAADWEAKAIGFESKIQGLEQSSNDSQAENLSLKIDFSQLQEKLKTSETEAADRERLKSQIEELKIEVSKYQSENKALNHKEILLGNSLQSCKEQLGTLQKDHNELRDQYVKRGTKVNNLRRTTAKFERMVEHSRKALKTERSQHRVKEDQSAELVRRLDAQLEEARTDLKNRLKENMSLKEKELEASLRWRNAQQTQYKTTAMNYQLPSTNVSRLQSWQPYDDPTMQHQLTHVVHRQVDSSIRADD